MCTFEKQCIISNNNMASSKDYFESFKPIRNRLRGFNVFDTLAVIRKYVDASASGKNQYQYIWQIEKSGQNIILPNIYDFLIVNTIIYSHEYPSKQSITSSYERGKLLTLVYNIEDKISKSQMDNNVWLWFYTFIHNQAKQKTGNIFTQFYRHYKIFSAPEIQNRIEQTIGMPYKDFMICAFWLYSVFSKSTGFCMSRSYLTNFPSEYAGTPFTKENIQKILSYLSCPLADLRKKLKATVSYTEDSLFNYFNSPHIHFPIIEHQDFFYCPLPHYLLSQLTAGMYYIADIPNAKLQQIYGQQFEKYVGEIIRYNIGNKQIFVSPEIKYGGKQIKKTSDWIISDGHNLIFIECKTKRLQYQSKQQQSVEGYLLEDIEKLASGICQLYKVYRDYKTGLISQLPYDENKTFRPIILTLEEWYANIPEIHDKITELTKQNLINAKIDPLIVDEFRFTVKSIQNFETDIQIMVKEGISNYYALLEQHKIDENYKHSFKFDMYFSDTFEEEFIIPNQNIIEKNKMIAETSKKGY